MANTNAAFYIPITANSSSVKKNSLNVWKNTTALAQSIGGNAGHNVEGFVREIAKNINVQSTSDFFEKYALTALTELAEGGKISGTKLADILMNTYAPALNLAALQTGYNSIENLIKAVENGSVNFSTFLENLSSGFQAVSDEISAINYSSYGREYPIDLVESFEKILKINTPAHNINSDISDYVSGLRRIIISITAHIKNRTTNIQSIDTLTNIFREVMAEGTPITFRLGRDIYKSCALAKFTPLVTNIYELKFSAQLIYELPKSSNSDGSYIANTVSGVVNGGVKIAKNSNKNSTFL